VSQEAKTIVIVDDDEMIHLLWESKLSEVSRDACVVHICSIASLKDWVNCHQTDLAKSVFLVDYELGDYCQTGLDAVEELALQKIAVLVTSRSEEEDLKLRCSKGGVPLVSKSVISGADLDLNKLHPRLGTKAA